MKIGGSLVSFAVKRPKTITWLMAIITLVLALLAGLPSIWPEAFPFLAVLKVDTDPENMLPANEPVRLFHNRMKEEMAIHDMVVLGVVNDTHPDGVFNQESLAKVYDLSQFAKDLRWEDPGRPGSFQGVIEVDLIAPSTVENILQAGPGTVKFEWLMPLPPDSKEEARAIREKAARIPFLKDTLLSPDGKALALYLPLTSKDQSYRVAQKIKEKIEGFTGNEKYFITGLPVAQDTFGVEMFKQMAIAAPAAMLIIFLLMLFFFRKIILIISPLLVAMVSVIATMSILVITGQTIHIMSSMIPIFIMPIAVLDAVHILSEFFDRYQETKSRRETIYRVMNTLFQPMLYTSLTTSVGFASLALTPIPPVQIFGIYIAIGVMFAWIWTILFIPAFIMLIPSRRFDNFGTLQDRREDREIALSVTKAKHRIRSNLSMTWLLATAGRLTFRHAKIVLALVAIGVVVAIFGINRIVINDNPTKWFSPAHPIREADRVMNSHFAGTYMAYLTLSAPEEDISVERYAEILSARLAERAARVQDELPESAAVYASLQKEIDHWKNTAASIPDLFEKLTTFAESRADQAGFEEMDSWDDALLFIGGEQQRGEIFKQPEILAYIQRLQEHLLNTGVVGKSNSLTDIVKTVYRELISGKDRDFVIPDTSSAVAQALITYQNSHRPQDLWHFVTPNYRKTILWIQLKSGDNTDMEKVLKAVDDFIARNPPPEKLDYSWFGLTYINVIWQRKMVTGMLQAFLGSFLIIFLMMTLLYRSALWGFLSMIPLTVTIGLIYGMIGLIGKNYDMPVAVLSSLSLGLAVDYAIHFLSRSRELYSHYGSWGNSAAAVFGEPARAIARNVIVIGIGFLPLLLAPLVPYQTVGIFIAAILFTAGVATLLIIPALMTVLEHFLFPKTKLCCLACNCTTCIISSIALIAVVAINLKQFFQAGWTGLSWGSLAAVIILILICYIMSRRDRCRFPITPIQQDIANKNYSWKIKEHSDKK